MQCCMCSFLDRDELVSCSELNGCFFELESLVEYFEDVGFSIVTGGIHDCVSLFVGVCVCDDGILVFEYAVGVGDAGVAIVGDFEVYGSLWSGENSCCGILGDSYGAETDVLSLCFSSAVFFVDLDEVVSGFDVGESYAFKG